MNMIVKLADFCKMVDNKEVAECGQVIGKADKMYTLWSYCYGDIRDTYNYYRDGGMHYTKGVACTYIHNVGDSLEDVYAKFPELIVADDLRGSSHVEFPTRIHIEIADDEFSCGKYCRTKIADCNDFGYLCWASNNAANFAHAELIQKRFIELGGFEVFGHYYDNEEDAADAISRAKEIEEQDKFIADIINSNGAPFEIDFDRNLDGYGECFDSKSMFLFQFKNYVTMWYNGYEYGLPTINGKGKRMKNKTLRITDYEIDTTCSLKNCCRNKIIVNNFEIVKK